MNTLPVELQMVTAQDIHFDEDSLAVVLMDGRVLSVPLTWYPRLYHGTVAERNNWRWIGKGEGIHWPDLDEDIHVQSLLLGRASVESQKSLARWLQMRKPA